jgi:hypothetical protein
MISAALVQTMTSSWSLPAATPALRSRRLAHSRFFLPFFAAFFAALSDP